MTFEPIWGSIIAWYLFLAGLGGGAFITAGFLRFRHPEAVHLRKIGHVMAPVVVAIGLVLLIFDAKAGLHSPLRFALLLTNFGSVMTWGVVFLAAFMVVSLAVLVFDVLKRKVPLALEIVGMACGVCVGMYTGALLGVCQTFPLWNNALLPILFLVSALSTGAAAVLCCGIVLHPEEFNRVGALKRAHYCLPLIELVMVASLLFVTASVSDAGFNSVMSLLVGDYAWLFWIGLFLVGLAGPSLVETWLLFFAKRSFEASRKAQWISFGADVGVLIGGFLLRYLVIVASLPLTMAVPML
ncbi:polysulfide reductase [Eggerthellaceae bacterium zg-887]|uniref:NrfD/PsrC family molybdoenzyme membrane anchor subunit n=1 Tax=Xiamenia xianingshaonis TaxID=2682776 RepID=UPI00140A7D74|nr:NrfD/PsrC family molybdoenzyme membrane anchor subunit [Xiamenia xianingshaonis]NHM16894.1 polysulfide reductase [Xiamenia xianingshaonis]